MANPTTNFGWQMPENTDLVKDLPADFEVFGQAVDTDLADLKGGTTGQVLSKTSNTDLDFTWVTPTDQTPLTTKGDIFTFTTVDARLGVGANGTVLTADSSEATGLKWATAAGGMTLISTTSLSGTSVTLTSIPQTYKKLVIYISGATNTATSSFVFSLQINGETGSKYTYVSMNSANGSLNASAANYTAIRMQGSTVNYSSMMNNLTIEIDNYTYAQQKAVKYYGTGSISGTPADDAEFYMGVGGYAIDAAAANAAVTSLTIFDSYGSRTFDGGTIYFYGVN